MLQHTKAIRESLESKLRQLWTASDEERQPFIDALNDLNENERKRNDGLYMQRLGKFSRKTLIIEGIL